MYGDEWAIVLTAGEQEDGPEILPGPSSAAVVASARGSASPRRW